MKEKYMREALKEAEKAKKLNEVPIGCVIVKDNKIIGRGYNRRMKDKNTLSHAELNAIKKASKKLKDWRLDDCEMYVTLEPCNMCMNAIELCRLKKVYFLIQKTKNIDIKSSKYEHINENNESLKLLQTFFQNKR